MKALIELGRQGSKLEKMLVYIPAKPPLSDEDKQRDPFAIYTVVEGYSLMEMVTNISIST